MISAVIVPCNTLAGQEQGAIRCATFINANGYQAAGTSNASHISHVVNGKVYMAITDNGDDGDGPHFPIINGFAYPSSITDKDRVYLAFFDENCNQTFGTYVPSGSTYIDDFIISMLVDSSGNVVVVGHTESVDFPTTDGTVSSGGEDIFVVKYDQNGNQLFATVIGGSGHDDDMTAAIIDETNGDIYLFGYNLASTDFLTTDGSSGVNKEVIIKYDSIGNLIYSTILPGGSGINFLGGAAIYDGDLYLMGFTTSIDYPTTDGSTYNGGISDFSLLKLNQAGLIEKRILIGGSDTEENTANMRIHVDSTGVFLMGQTRSADFPTTDGSSSMSLRSICALKYDLDFNVVYSKILTSTGSDWIQDFEVVNGDLFLLGYSYAEGYPIVNGLGYSGSGSDYVLTRLDAFGNIVYSSYYGGISGERQENFFVSPLGEVYLALPGRLVPTTDGSSYPSRETLNIVKFNADGSLAFSTLLTDFVDGPADLEIPGTVFGQQRESSFEVNGNVITLVGTSGTGASTDGTLSWGVPPEGFWADPFILKYDLCPDPPVVTNDPVSPISQVVCQNGLVQQISAEAIELDGSTLPTIYVNGVEGSQANIEFQYQWEISTSPTGTWTTINDPLARRQNYSPPPTTQSVYYRRVTSQSSCCGSAVVSVSDTAAVLISSDVAPTVEAGGIFYTCPGDSILLGGTPSASGGAGGGYVYSWDFGIDSIANPVVIPMSNTIYTLYVEDANGCVQSDQAGVIIYEADAGADQSICGNDDQPIGGPPLVGVPVVPFGSPTPGQYSISYDWLPDNGSLSCILCPNPIANPITAQTYYLDVTLYKPDGTSCTTSDSVHIDVIPSPLNSDFAGNDQIVCLGETVTLGTPAEPDIEQHTIISVSQTSVNGETATASNLTDSDLSTGGLTTNTGTQRIDIDLGSIQDFNNIQLAALSGTTNTSNRFRVQVSQDGISFSTIITNIYGSSIPSLTGYEFGSVNARYIRLEDRFSDTYVAISEIKVSKIFRYSWAPGFAINPNDASEVLFNPGQTELPTPNPFTYTVSMEAGDCIYYDQVSVAVIEARAGDDGCGPRVIGEPDRTPNIEETYLWEKISNPVLSTGSGDITGPLNTATTTVSESVGGQVAYQLTSSYTYGGATKTCLDTVIVTECGSACAVEIAAVAEGCPRFTPLGPIFLEAKAGPNFFSNPDEFIYDWTPTQGLDTYSGRFVRLTDTIQRTYTVTMTSPYDSSFLCTQTIDVNLPIFSAPIFNGPATVTTCAGAPVQIGDPLNNPNYSYSWTPTDDLDDPSRSNPTATVFQSTSYYVAVTDTTSGCIFLDTVIIDLGDVARAGPDVTLCDNGIVTLGQNIQDTSYTYSWQPSMAAYVNGTSSTDAMPDVFFSATGTTVFSLTMTNNITGCISTDTVNIFVDSIPPILSLPDVSFCPSQSDTLVLGIDNGNTSGISLVPDGYQYAWSPATYLDDELNVANPRIIPSSTDLPNEELSFSLSLLSPTGGCNAMSSQLVSPIVETPMTTPISNICLGDVLNIGDPNNASGPNITYSWSPSAQLDDPSSSNPLFTPTTAGVYTFTVIRTDNSSIAGCSSEATVTINVQEVDLPGLAPVNICQGNQPLIGILTADNALSYSWSPQTDLSNPFIANPIFTGVNSASYTLYASNSLGCVAQTSVVVNVSTDSAPVLSIPDQNVCYTETSSTVLEASVSPAGAYTYQWSPTAYLDNDNIEDPLLTIPAVGTYLYTLTVFDQDNGCTSEGTVSIIASALDEHIIFDTPEEQCMDGTVMNISASPTPSFGLQGTFSSGASGLIDHGDGTASLQVNSAGEGDHEVSYTIEDSGGCTKSESVIITINDCPKARAWTNPHIMYYRRKNN